VVAGLPSVIGGQEKTPHELDLVRRRARSLCFTDVRLSQNRAQIHTGLRASQPVFYNARDACVIDDVRRLRRRPRVTVTVAVNF